MFEFLSKIYEPIRRGNEYRREKYGASNYMKSRIVYSEGTPFGMKMSEHPTGIECARGVPVFPNSEWDAEIARDKTKFATLMLWTGARFVEEDNLDYDDRMGDLRSVGYFDINSGTWKAWSYN